MTYIGQQYLYKPLSPFLLDVPWSLVPRQPFEASLSRYSTYEALHSTHNSSTALHNNRQNIPVCYLHSEFQPHVSWQLEEHFPMLLFFPHPIWSLPCFMNFCYN